MLYDLGRWDELLLVADALLSSAPAEGPKQYEMVAASYKAHVLARRGRTREAVSLLETVLAPARATGELQVLIPALVIAAAVSSEAGDFVRALALVDEVGEVSRNAPAFRKRMIVDLARVATSHEAVAIAAGLIDGLGMVLTRDRYSLMEAQGLVAEASGDPSGALDLYRQAASSWEGFTFPFERAYSLSGAGRCLVALGRPEEARPLLGEAATIFGDLQARPYIDRVDADLRRISALTS
jgi:tetratricopeptide (TPR) repeat protein